MTTPPILACAGFKGGRRLRAEKMPAAPPASRVPRVARLMALARKMDHLLRQGTVANAAVMARLGHVSRARITQILNLLHLAPDIQEQILFLARTLRGRDPIQLGQLQAITQVLDWTEQRALWQTLRNACLMASIRDARLAPAAHPVE